MLSVLGMNSEVWNVDPTWGNTYPEATDSLTYWNGVMTAREVGVPEASIA